LVHQVTWAGYDDTEEVDYEEEGGKLITGVYPTFDIYVCPVCTQANVVETDYQDGYDEKENPSASFVQVLRPSDWFAPVRPHWPSLVPQDVTSSLWKAKKLLVGPNVDPQASAGHVRTALQLIIDHKGISLETLSKSIEASTQWGVFAKELHDIATLVRELGNICMHNSDRIGMTANDVAAAIEVFEIFLTLLCDLPNKIEYAQSVISKLKEREKHIKKNPPMT
jgi:hypothetical protein